MPRHLVLIGMMGAGKTTTGRALAARLGWPMRDCDRDLEERTGRTGADLAATEGIEYLHRLEEEILLEVLAGDGPLIVTAAGSVVTSERVRWRLAQRATVVWLDVPLGDLLVRMTSGPHRRPLDPQAAEELLAQREANLAELADLRLDARTPTGDLVDEIMKGIGHHPA